MAKKYIGCKITGSQKWAAVYKTMQHTAKHYKLEMWANARNDGHPAEYRWRPLFNATKFG